MVDQPARLRSLIYTFVVHCLDSVIPILTKSIISRFYLAFVAEQISLSLTWSQTSKDRFYYDVAHSSKTWFQIDSSFKTLLHYKVGGSSFCISNTVSWKLVLSWLQSGSFLWLFYLNQQKNR